MTRRPFVHPSLAAARVLAVAYLIGFGLATLSAVLALVSPTPAGGDRAAAGSAWSGYLLQLLLAGAAGAYGFRAVRRFGVDDVDLGMRPRPAARAAVSVAVLYVAALAAAAWVTVQGVDMAGLGAPATVTGVTAQLGPELFHAASAGLVEELVLLALPLALARRCGWSTATTLAVLVVMRLGIHLYLGWYALFVIPWLFGAVLLWRRCPSVWPFIVGHGVYDVAQVLALDGGWRTAQLAGSAMVGFAAVGATVVVWLRSGNRQEVEGEPIRVAIAAEQ